MCPGKVDESPICPGNPWYPSWIKDISQGWYTATCFVVLSLLWVSVIDLESPVVESGWKHFGSTPIFCSEKKHPSKCCDFLLGHVPFCHWGLLGSRVGYIRLTCEACFEVRAKTRVVQICQVQRQVHPADVFDGGLFVIKLGRTKKLQTWNSSCNSPGAGKMTSNLVPKVNIFWRCVLRRQNKGNTF